MNDVACLCPPPKLTKTIFKRSKASLAWWLVPIISGHRRLRQEDFSKSEANLNWSKNLSQKKKKLQWKKIYKHRTEIWNTQSIKERVILGPLKNIVSSRAVVGTPPIPALGRQREVDLWEFKASLVYRVSSRSAKATKRNKQDWRDGSAVKRTDCSSKGPEFKSQQHVGSQPSVQLQYTHKQNVYMWMKQLTALNVKVSLRCNRQCQGVYVYRGAWHENCW